MILRANVPTRALLSLTLVSVMLMSSGCGREDDRPASFTYVYDTILGPSCATIGCHNSFTQIYGFQFNTKEGMYAILRGHACYEGTEIEGASRNYVYPGDPERSRLIHLLYGEDVALRMPPDRGLSSVDIELVEQWILEGAKCD